MFFFSLFLSLYSLRNQNIPENNQKISNSTIAETLFLHYVFSSETQAPLHAVTSHLLSITWGTNCCCKDIRQKRNGCWSLSPDVLVTMVEMTYSIYFLHIYLSSLSSLFLCMGQICISFDFLFCLCLHLPTCTLNCLMDFPGLCRMPSFLQMIVRVDVSNVFPFRDY